MINYDINKLPDFYSVRSTTQIDYAFEGMEGMQCLLFLDNGFCSTYVETNKRDIKYIWDGFVLFIPKDMTLDDIRNGVNLHDTRLMALQRTKYFEKANDDITKKYIISKIKKMGLTYKVMEDNNEIPIGYPAKGDMWSTRDESVLNDAIDCIETGMAIFYPLSEFSYSINFNSSNIPTLSYIHKGGIVLKNENDTILVRILDNDNILSNYINSFGKDSVSVEELKRKK